MVSALKENLWVVVQPASDIPGQWLARCLNLDIVSTSASLDGVQRALTEAISLCLDEDGPSARRKAEAEEWALLERVLRDGRGGVPELRPGVVAVTQLRLGHPQSSGSRSARWQPWVWMDREALTEAPAPLFARRSDSALRRRQNECGRARPAWGKSRGSGVSSAPEIIVTTQDFERLQRLVACTESTAAERLDAELARAQLVAPTEIPADVVTMNSNVVYEDQGSGEQRAVRLVYPNDAEAERGWVSVLAPVGSALLGLRQGQEIDWPTPRGTRRLRVVAVPYQPESHGHFAL